MPKKATRSRVSSRTAAAPCEPPPPSLLADPTTRREFVPGFEFDREAADRPRRFIEQFCRHRSEDGRILSVKPLAWHRDDVLYPLFGWKRPNGRLRFRRAGIFVPKKNRKTTISSQIVQYANAVMGMDVFLAANTRDQARTMWRMVAGSISASPALADVYDVIEHKSVIRHRIHRKEIKCLSADVKTHEGLNGMIMLDEIHSFPKPDLVDTVMYATRGIPNSMVISVSTAGENRNWIGYQWWKDAVLAMQDPSVNPSFYGMIYGADLEAGDDPHDPAVWKRANPAMGEAFTEDEFRSDYEDACTDSRKFSKWLRYSLNCWVESDSRWFTGDAFANCRQAPPEDLAGRPCVVGVDLASNLDMTAACFLFKAADGSYDAVMKYWVPEETVQERERRDRVPYSTWIREGWLTVTPGARLDHEFVARDILAFGADHKLVSVGCDPWQVGPLATFLQRENIEVKGVAQTTQRLNSPCKMLEGLVVEGRFRYQSPILLFNANHCLCYTDATGMIKPDKGKSTEKIDGLAAAANAFAMAISSDEDLSPPSPDDYRLVPLW